MSTPRNIVDEPCAIDMNKGWEQQESAMSSVEKFFVLLLHWLIWLID